MTKRKAFNFYSSHWEQIKLLNKKQQLELTIAICQVQFFEINIEDVVFKDNISTLVWTGIKHSIETSIKGFVSKHKALGKEVVIPLSKGGDKAPYQEVQVQEKEQVKGEGEGQLKTLFNFRKELLNLGVNEKIAEDWLKVRKTKKASNTETALNAINKQIALSGKSTNECIKIAVENSWSGFKNTWLGNLNTSGTNGTPVRKKQITDINEDAYSDPDRLKW